MALRCGSLLIVFAVLLGLFIANGPFVADFLEERFGIIELVGLLPVFVSKEERLASFNGPGRGSLEGHVAIITGANVGLGKASTEMLAQSGATVVMACRRLEKCEEAKAQISPNDKLHCLRVDMSSLVDVSRFSKEFLENYKRLDIFIMNAGVTFFKDKEVSKDGVEMMFAVNHLAHFLMYKEFKELIGSTASKFHESEDSLGVRVVAVSSLSHVSTVPGGIYLTLDDINDESKYSSMRAYGQSKLANILFANELARRHENETIFSNSLHPGMVLTNTTADGQAFIKRLLHFESLGRIFQASWDFVTANLLWSAREGALCQVYLGTSPEVRKRNIRGKYLHPIQRIVRPSLGKDEELGKKLWKLSEEILKAKGIN